MFNLGPMEVLVIFVVALLVFGPKKLPELGKSLGKGLSEFRRASAELQGSLQREMDNIEHEVKQQEAQKVAPPPVQTVYNSNPVPTNASQYPVYQSTQPAAPAHEELHAGLTPEATHPDEYHN